MHHTMKPTQSALYNLYYYLLHAYSCCIGSLAHSGASARDCKSDMAPYEAI